MIELKSTESFPVTGRGITPNQLYDYLKSEWEYSDEETKEAIRQGGWAVEEGDLPGFITIYTIKKNRDVNKQNGLNV